MQDPVECVSELCLRVLSGSSTMTIERPDDSWKVSGTENRSATMGSRFLHKWC